MDSDLFGRLQDEINARDGKSGLSPIDLLDLPETLAAIVNSIIRSNGMQLDQIAQTIEMSVPQTQQLLNDLNEKGYVRKVQVKDNIWYKANFGRKAEGNNRTGIWSILDGIT